jgi:integrase
MLRQGQRDLPHVFYRDALIFAVDVLAKCEAEVKSELEKFANSDLPGGPKSEIKNPNLATPTKSTAKDINKLVEQIRSGQPPELPEGTREKHYRDPALPGLHIRLLNTGVASWVVQWKRLGRQKKKALGDVLVLDRPEAIKAAKELLAKITLGTLDPHAARRERMRANKVTFKTVVPLFMEDKKRKGELRSSTAKPWKSYLTGYYFQPLHNLPIDEITEEQIETQLEFIAIQSGDGAANACHAVMRVFFKWARKKKLIPTNPMTDIEPPRKNEARERVLTNDEIQLIWKACEALEDEAIHYQEVKALTGKGPWNGKPPVTDTPRGVMLLFLTGCRAHEIGDLQWSEIDPLDNAELHIPKERTKTGNNLDNPLSDEAVKILRRVKRRPDRTSVFGHAKRNGQDLRCAKELIDRQIENMGVTPPKNWRVHDIRRTFRTRMAALKVSNDVAEALLGHIGHRSKSERTYNRHEYWAEKRTALAMWEANLRAIIDGTAEKIAHPNFGQRKEASHEAS